MSVELLHLNGFHFLATKNKKKRATNFFGLICQHALSHCIVHVHRKTGKVVFFSNKVFSIICFQLHCLSVCFCRSDCNTCSQKTTVKIN